MSRIEWKEHEFTVFDETLDSQHNQLIQQYNALHEVLINGSLSESTDEQATTLENMVEYAETHFKTEEKYMEDIGYPDTEKHKQTHQNFRDRINSLQRDMDQGRVVLSTTLMKFLKNWIVEHIAIEDKKYGQYHKQRRQQQNS